MQLYFWAISSVGQSICLTSRGSQVRVLYRPPFAEIAQLVEQLICNQQVPGSSPGFGTIFFGEVAKWLNATDCKSVLIEFDGSNPSLSTTLDIASQPSGKASDFDSDMRQFESNRGSQFSYDLLAQQVEHLTFNQRVMSSNLIQVTIDEPEWRNWQTHRT